MADLWYYGRDDNKIGPFSDRQLRDLADAKEIHRTDTVWKEGIERGVAASNVKNLFPLAVSDLPRDDAKLPDTNVDSSSQSPAGTPTPKNLTAAAGDADPRAHQKVPESTYRPAAQQVHIPKKRAVAGKGTIIVGQDGTNVRIKKKCSVCGYEDSCWHTMRIMNGMNKATFFCQNCRKKRQVEFRGIAK